MLKNYLTVALRIMDRQIGYTLINTAGLVIGMTCFILIALWVRYELSFDTYHDNARDLFRINTKTRDSIIVSSSFALAPALKADYPEIRYFTRYWFYGSMVKYNGKTFKTNNRFCTADPDIFNMFTFSFIQGDPNTALSRLNAVVLTESTAQKLFGDDDPMGQVLTVDNEHDFIVTGVIRNLPGNSHLQFDFLARIELMPQERLESWEFIGPSYVLLRQNTPVEAFNQKIAGFYRRMNPETTMQPYLQNVTDIHLYEYGVPGRIKYVYIFSTIAIFVLLIACTNFMNLATARSGSRAREVGMRKVVGAQRRQLIGQFLIESFLITALACLVSCGIVELLLPSFNHLVGAHISFADLMQPGLVFMLTGLVFFVGFAAGSYPALFLSAFQPSRVLKKDVTFGGNKTWFRTILVVVQFSISIIIIICTIIINRQLGYIKNRDPGFDRERVVFINNNKGLLQNFEPYKKELMENPNISSVSAASTLPTNVGQAMRINWEGNGENEGIGTRFAMVDHDFIKTFNIQIVQGRDFSRAYATDATDAYIINEAALKRMNMVLPLGKRLYFGDKSLRFYHEGTIIGVVKDFHMRSMREAIGPFLLRIYPPWFNYIFIKIQPGNMSQTIRDIKRISEKHAPEYPFDYAFLDEAFDDMYRSEQQMGRITTYFAFLAVFISCLGLFGLTSFMAEQRTKEIGIRKALGASVSGIILMLSRECMIGVAVANIVAWPVAYGVMSRWLQDFAYRIPVEFWTFFLSAGLALVIALLTVGVRTVKAAFINPVESLRYE